MMNGQFKVKIHYLESSMSKKADDHFPNVSLLFACYTKKIKCCFQLIKAHFSGMQFKGFRKVVSLNFFLKTARYFLYSQIDFRVSMI